MSSSADQIPTDVSAIYLDDTSIRVSFTEPTGIVNPNYYYHVVLYDSSGNVYDNTGTSSPITIYGLTENTTYSYYVETVQTASTGYTTVRTTQWPRIYTFYTSDVSYNAAKLNWTGLDFSFVGIVRYFPTVDVSYVWSNNAASYYDSEAGGADLSGNTLYYYYITPYLYLNDVLNTGTVVVTTVTTAVAPPTGVVAAATVDGSAITLSYTAAKNSYSNSMYYTARSAAATTDVSSTETSLTVSNLSGNTSYSFYVSVCIDASSALVATSDAVSATTAVQAPTGVVSFYDSSAIRVAFTSKNTYSSILFSAAAGSTSASAATSPVLVQNLSGNTVYSITVTNTLNGNSALSASSVLADTVTTGVQPPSALSLYSVDASAIGLSFTAGANSYSSILWTATAADSSGRVLTTATASSGAPPIYLTDLSGNTEYTATVSVELNGNSALSTTASSSITATTGVRPPYNLLLSFYDSSSIAVAFSAAPNTYTSVVYNAYVSDTSGNNSTAQNTASPVQVRGLSADTTYTFYIKNTLNGNATLTAQSETILATTSGYPVNKVIYLTGVTYSSITVNWAGVDISYVMVYRNAASLGTDYLTPYDDVDLSGNTDYVYYVVPYFIDRGVIITGEPSATVSTTTPVAPVSDLSMTFYDSSAITVSFTAGRNSYSSSVVYMVGDTNINIDTSSTSSSPVSIVGLSGNTTYNIYIKTIVDGSYNAISETTVSATTDIQCPKNPYISFYDNSAITVEFNEPVNKDVIYYVATASDICGVSIVSTNTTTPIKITELFGNTLYYISVATVVSGNVSSSPVSLGSVRTGIINPYNITTTEISTTDNNLASIIDISFATPSQSGSVYYIVSASSAGKTFDVSASTSPIQITGLSGNTTYSVNLTTVIDGTPYVSTAPSITTAIQGVGDVEILSLVDASFTIGFTPRKNTGYSYYILRATDVSSGAVFDVSGTDSVLYMYDTDLNTDSYYEIDIITVVDGSMISHGGLFRVATVQLPYDIYATEMATDDPAAASYLCVYFTAPEQYQTVYYVASISEQGTGATVDVSATTSPIQLTGLSGNTTYSITFTTVLNDRAYVSDTTPTVTTAIQTPVDVELLSMEDVSFTVSFTTGRNTSVASQYYILRATDVNSSAVFDVSSEGGMMSIYESDLSFNSYYDIDILTVVDGSMVSYGDLFSVATAQLPYDIYAREIATNDPDVASYVCVYFTVPDQYQTMYYVVSVSEEGTGTGATVDVSATASPIQLTGLSGNTTYSITFTTILNGLAYVSDTAMSVTTAIQTPVDVEILNLEDASFTVSFTTRHNSSAAEATYYVLRATDVSSGEVVDVSGTDGVLSMYGNDVLTTGNYYTIDLLTVVDSSMVSYGDVFTVMA